MSIIPTTDTIGINEINLDHLHKSTASQLKNVLESYKSIFATSKFDLGCINGFKVEAEIVAKPGVRCKQPPRNKILPQNCVDNINQYVDAELLIPIEQGVDEFCANITLVKRSNAPGSVKQTKADKHILKQTKMHSRMIPTLCTGLLWIFARSIAVQ